MKKLYLIIFIILGLITIASIYYIGKSPKEVQPEKSFSDLLREQRAESLERRRQRDTNKPENEEALKRWGM